MLGTFWPASPAMPHGSDAESLNRRAETELLVAQRRWPDALDAAGRYRDTLRDPVVNRAWAPWRSLRAEALAGLQRREEATELREEQLAWARRWGAAGPVSRVLRLLGTIGAAPSLERLREAVDITDGSYARLEHAKALVAPESALRRGRKPSAAREPLRRDLELAMRCGAGTLADHARAELYAAGGAAQALRAHRP